ncbi:hypothetical protein BKA64DRAFT_637919 [Cadophora sp. MPI-SDFR-AT-0126]|nr:hypothetical protein BKA64DRAFT_637919 [Leotiomycetes sp. MPI-SDFR-AT-0126]
MSSKMLSITKLVPNKGCILQLRFTRTPLLIAASTTDDNSTSKGKKIPFRRFDAAEKFVGEKVRAVLKAKHLIDVHWNEIEDDVYATAEERRKEIERVWVAESTTTDDFQNHIRTIKVSRALQYRIEPKPQPIAYEIRPVAESMSIAASKWLSKMMMKRDKPRGALKNRNMVIKAEVGTQEVSEWSWNDDTQEESWEDLGIEKHHTEISWDEMCYREKPSVKAVSCFQPSRLRWSLTVREE